MEKTQILSEVTEVFRDILGQPELVLNFDTTAEDVEYWDSLNHMQLVVAIEKRFKIRFTIKEMQSWKNVGEMVGDIHKRTS